MEITKKQADVIIKNLKTIINEDINYISKEGYIIASSDETRVGNFHGGGHLVSKTKKPLIIHYDGEYEGSKKGINLPIFFENNLTAVIGITGEADEIIQFSKVIVKMTEILIKENLIYTQRQFKRENNRILMELIIKNKFNPEILKLKMEELSYNINKYNYFICMELKNFNLQNIELSNKIYNSIEKRIKFDCILTRDESRFLLLSQRSSYNELYEKLKIIKNYIESKYKIILTIGISEEIQKYENIYNAYREAVNVCEIDKYKDSGIIAKFDSTNVDYLLQTLSTSKSFQHFSKKLFQTLTNEEVKEIKTLINEYILHNGSIKKLSKSLYVHKNTVQYRLNKVFNLTGYNPRVLKDLIGLFIALSIIN